MIRSAILQMWMCLGRPLWIPVHQREPDGKACDIQRSISMPILVPVNIRIFKLICMSWPFLIVLTVVRLVFSQNVSLRRIN